VVDWGGSEELTASEGSGYSWSWINSLTNAGFRIQLDLLLGRLRQKDQF
jgi:hypothetical protein